MRFFIAHTEAITDRYFTAVVLSAEEGIGDAYNGKARLASLNKKSTSINGSEPRSCQRIRPAGLIKNVPWSGLLSKSS